MLETMTIEIDNEFESNIHFAKIMARVLSNDPNPEKKEIGQTMEGLLSYLTGGVEDGN